MVVRCLQDGQQLPLFIVHFFIYVLSKNMHCRYVWFSIGTTYILGLHIDTLYLNFVYITCNIQMINVESKLGLACVNSFESSLLQGESPNKTLNSPIKYNNDLKSCYKRMTLWPKVNIQNVVLELYHIFFKWNEAWSLSFEPFLMQLYTQNWSKKQWNTNLKQHSFVNFNEHTTQQRNKVMDSN